MSKVDQCDIEEALVQIVFTGDDPEEDFGIEKQWT